VGEAGERRGRGGGGARVARRAIIDESKAASESSVLMSAALRCVNIISCHAGSTSAYGFAGAAAAACQRHASCQPLAPRGRGVQRSSAQSEGWGAGVRGFGSRWAASPPPRSMSRSSCRLRGCMRSTTCHGRATHRDGTTRSVCAHASKRAWGWKVDEGRCSPSGGPRSSRRRQCARCRRRCSSGRGPLAGAAAAARADLPGGSGEDGWTGEERGCRGWRGEGGRCGREGGGNERARVACGAPCSSASRAASLGVRPSPASQSCGQRLMPLCCSRAISLGGEESGKAAASTQ